MISISEDQALDRWGALPDVLREAIVSDTNSEFIWKTCEDEHIPEEKIPGVARAVGYVLLGFLHPEDISKELQERLNIDIQLANLIADTLNKRVFMPIRADLNKSYSPLNKLESPARGLELKTLQDIDAPLRPITTPSNNSVAPPPKPTTLSDVGWSRASSAGPGIKLTTLSNTAAAPQPPRAPAVPTPPSRPLTPTAQSEPAPMMLHEDTSFKAAEKNAGFTLSKPGAGAEVHMAQGTSQTPARPAVLEFGGAKPPTPPQNKPTAASAPSATHYTELKLSLSAVPTANSGQRNVSQIAPSIPKPPTSPQSAVPVPRPPQPPQIQQMPPVPQSPKPPQNNKPIVKDFL